VQGLPVFKHLGLGVLFLGQSFMDFLVWVLRYLCISQALLKRLELFPFSLSLPSACSFRTQHGLGPSSEPAQSLPAPSLRGGRTPSTLWDFWQFLLQMF
jgi:hypothetical protein